MVDSRPVWSTLSLRPALVPLIAMGGALVFQLAASLLGHRRAQVRPSPWWLALMTVAIGFLLARLIHRATSAPEVAVVAIRVQYAAGLVILPLAIGAIESILAYPRASRTLAAIAAAAIALVIATLATSWIVPADIVQRTDALGGQFFAPRHHQPALLAVFFVVSAIPVVVRLRRLPPEPRSTRWTFRVGALLLLTTGVNDTLLSAGVVSSVHLFEYGLGALAGFATVFVQRNADELQRELSRQVAERTAALAQALDEVRRGEERYRTLADASSEAVVVLADEVVVDVNRAYVALCQPATAVIGRSVRDAMGARIAPADQASLGPLLTGERPGPIEVRVNRPDGTAAEVELRMITGTGDRRVVLGRDVTAQKELRGQLLRADRLAAMGTLAAGTAHEINNPLTFVVNNAELLREMLDSGALDVDEARALLADISSGGERIRTIVRDLMTLVRDPGDEARAVDVRAILDGSLAIAGNRLRHRARVERRYAAQLPLVAGNEVRLGQVFLNLLLNAADALPDGHADAHQVVVAAAPDDGGGVVVRISDSGVGMTAAVRDRIFDPFFTSKDVGQGTGLGLSVSLGIVAALGGRIEVTSEPGHGSTFAVHLRPAAPAPTAPSGSAGSPALSTPRAVPPLAATRVLIVDDEPVVARSLAKLLAPRTVEVVTSGQAALAACQRGTYDAIVCDLMMPELTGMELHAQLRDTAPDLAARMIFVTGGAFTADAAAFVAARRAPVLTKPLDAAQLRAAVDAAAGR